MPLLQTSGNITADAYGGGLPVVPNYIEEVFSTYLYTGTGSAQTITNGIDLSTKGGLVWWKNRNATNSVYHNLADSARGIANTIYTNATDPQGATNRFTAFSTTGFSVSPDLSISGDKHVAWTFRKQPKFFDVVTWTGDGSGSRNIPHSLNSVPGCIMVKNTSSVMDWYVYHRSNNVPNASNPELNTLKLNTTDAGANTSVWNYTPPTSTQFTVSGPAFNVFDQTYVAYIYAHNAGGFGLNGTDNVISCGRYTGNSSTQNINLGYEPQFIIIKNITSAMSWRMFDTMRGMTADGTDEYLVPNLSDAASSITSWVSPTATGFKLNSANANINESGSNYIYIAIRKGPMKVPTDATKVFKAYTTTNSSTVTWTNGFPADFTLTTQRTTNDPRLTFNRLIGNYIYQSTTNANTETNSSPYGIAFDAPTNTLTSNIWGGANSVLWYSFRRAPSFFDQVCYTGDGVDGRTVDHNLTVAPELLIVKARSSATNWTGNYWPLGVNRYIYLNSANGASGSNGALRWASTAPTATQFTLGTIAETNASGVTFVAYLFASCPGVSKLGAYTGTGSAITIDCGFPAGAKFVMIKRTDIGSTTGDWYVWDTARGMISGTDPSISLNAAGAESNTNSVYTVTNGFQILASPTPDINTSGATYFYLAIA